MTQTATLETVIDKVHQISANHYDEVVPVQDMEFDSLNQASFCGQFQPVRYVVMYRTLPLAVGVATGNATL